MQRAHVNGLANVGSEIVSVPKFQFDGDRSRALTRPIKLMLKIGSIHTERVNARQLICIN